MNGFLNDWLWIAPSSTADSFGLISTHFEAYAEALAELHITKQWLHFIYPLHVHYVLRATAGLRPTLEAGIDLALLRFLNSGNRFDGRLCRTNVSVAHLLPRVTQPMHASVRGMCPARSAGAIACRLATARCAVDARFSLR